MKPPKITPGEWGYMDNGLFFEVYTNKPYPRCSFISCFDHIKITEISKAEACMNAKAISAVPNMIEALIHVLNHADAMNLTNRDVSIILNSLKKAGCTNEN